MGARQFATRSARWGVPDEDEQAWMAERRAFVANWRDGAADSREVVDDARDAAADLREAELDACERELELRAVELGLSGAPNPDLADIAAARARAAELRASLRTVRQGVDPERDEASTVALVSAPSFPDERWRKAS